jgi:general secretion pathway protein N
MARPSRETSVIVAALVLMFAGSCQARAVNLRFDDLRQTRERPLFSVTRRPPPKIDVSEAPAPPIVPPSLTLVGIVLSANERAVIVQEASSAKPVRLALGEAIKGWRVTSITPRTFVIKNGDHAATLTFPPPK